ncbi:hypothetical protein RvY_09630 [Ramazzottius varieornatus]|uniref:Uncharacterized protein n=1 Tax=Ramazzottius varieornatus TaxID=947166 RepID=A0A1D1VEJ2_RAMVA|nr:hypothetical protein RvY_09630 [Ramazzottius varieornatus]
MSTILAHLENTYAAMLDEIQALKDVCITTVQNTADINQRLLEEEQKFNETRQALAFSTKAADDTKKELAELSEAVSEAQNAYNAAVDTGSFSLDESFGPLHKEIDVLLKECNWNIGAFGALLKDRTAFMDRIKRLQNVEDVKKEKERAKQFSEVFDKYEILNKENQTLHAQQLRLKNELVAAERDLEKSCGVRRFDPSKAFNAEK